MDYAELLKRQEVTNKLDKLAKSFNSTYYVQSLHDPQQTHAIYGVHKDDVDELKAFLRNRKAYKFRIVKANAENLRIVCFSNAKMDK